MRAVEQTPSISKLSSAHLLHSVAHRLEFRSGLLVPEATVSYVHGYHEYGGGRHGYELQGEYLADLMWVTKSNYATEFEVKISRSDWKADNDKDKWGFLPPWITRFIYVVPVELGIPDFVPPFSGVWHWQSEPYSYGHITVARAPRKIGQTKVPPEVREKWLYHLHCRFWNQKLYVDRRLPRFKAATIEV